MLPVNVVFIATMAEEAGLLGAYAYVQNPLFPLKCTQFVFNFDLMGNGEKGMVAVAANQYPQLFKPLKHLNDSLHCITFIRTRDNAPISDHWPFTQAGVPALFFYTEGGAPNYHDIYDNPDQIRLPVFNNFLKMLNLYLTNLPKSKIKSAVTH